MQGDPGHRRRGWLTLLLAVCFTTLAATAAHAKSYSAERFDSRIELLPGGAIEVTETVVFRFEDGTFSHAFRDIPRRRTDGIEILRAAMDGREMPLGDGPGQVNIRQRSQVRIRWNFPEPVSDSSHVFTLTYRVHGAVRESDAGDLLAWRALPGKHDYPIDSSTIDIAHHARLAAQPAIDTRRVGAAQVQAREAGVAIAASRIRKNGWVDVRLHFARGSVISSPPAWQQAQRRADALAPRWLAAAAAICAAGLVLFWGMRRRYDPPPREEAPPGSVPAAPDDLPPALAGALASNGRVTHQHALSTLFALADRGAITISEERRRFGQRDFTVRRQARPVTLAAHEATVLEIAFSDKGRQMQEARLSKVGSRLASKTRPFRTAVYEEMRTAGLIDPDRKAMHAKLGATALTIVLIGSALFIAAAFLVPAYRGWPMLIPAAVVAAGVIGLIVQGATTPLSNEGVRRAARWRAYQQHLKQVARSQAHLTADSPTRVLPFAVSLGLAAAWAQFVKKHPAQVPGWFSAASSSGTDAFPAFIAFAGSSGGGGGAGGAAGGGASGAA